MELRDITMSDLPLYEAQLTDPKMMAQLGGPLPRGGLANKLRRIVDDVEAGKVWYCTIIPDEDDASAAGTVCIWEHEWNGDTIAEMGWMVLPEHQGRGLATAAVRSLLDRARREQRWGVVHAFPAVTNGPSNAISARAGFTLVGEVEVEGQGDYAGRTLLCNHWVIDLRAAT